MNRDKQNEIAKYYEMLGEVVIKHSKKPFKSGYKENTVIGITTNEFTNRIAFLFNEDDSVVECFKCRLF